MSGVCVVLEQKEKSVSRISWEAVAAGQWLASHLGLELTAAVIGADTGAAAQEVATKSVAKVTRIEHALLAQYTPDGFSGALEQFIASLQPAA